MAKIGELKGGERLLSGRPKGQRNAFIQIMTDPNPCHEIVPLTRVATSGASHRWYILHEDGGNQRSMYQRVYHADCKVKVDYRPEPEELTAITVGHTNTYYYGGP